MQISPFMIQQMVAPRNLLPTSSFLLGKDQIPNFPGINFPAATSQQASSSFQHRKNIGLVMLEYCFNL